MKYRITAFSYRNSKIRTGNFKAARRRVLSLCVLPPDIIYHGSTERENINFYTLFELGELPAPKSPPRSYRFFWLIKKFFVLIGKAIRASILFLLKIITYPFTRVRDKNQRLSFYSGVLVSAMLVATLSGVTVLAGLFGGYFAPYEELIVPNMVGEKYSDVEAAIDEKYELLVSYENSSEVPAGVIMSQTPDAGVTRKLYSNGEPCSLTVTVSAGRSFYTVTNIVGTDSRLSLLELQNNGVATNVVYEHSSDIASGIIISTSPTAGERLYDGDVLTIRISLGKKINTVTTPDLYGLNEAQAKALLEARGLTLGIVTYKSSTHAAGKIIDQQYSPYTALKEGSAVNVTVSLGSSVTVKTVPDLYGLSVSEAEAELAKLGIVVGGIYSVASGAPKGTVITQTPIAGTPITSSVTSVDLYISS